MAKDNQQLRKKLHNTTSSLKSLKKKVKKYQTPAPAENSSPSATAKQATDARLNTLKTRSTVGGGLNAGLVGALGAGLNQVSFDRIENEIRNVHRRVDQLQAHFADQMTDRDMFVMRQLELMDLEQKRLGKLLYEAVLTQQGLLKAMSAGQAHEILEGAKNADPSLALIASTSSATITEQEAIVSESDSSSRLSSDQSSELHRNDSLSPPQLTQTYSVSPPPSPPSVYAGFRVSSGPRMFDDRPKQTMLEENPEFARRISVIEAELSMLKMQMPMDHMLVCCHPFTFPLFLALSLSLHHPLRTFHILLLFTFWIIFVCA
jgi:hypothetical protein